MLRRGRTNNSNYDYLSNDVNKITSTSTSTSSSSHRKDGEQENRQDPFARAQAVHVRALDLVAVVRAQRHHDARQEVVPVHVLEERAPIQYRGVVTTEAP